MFESGERAGRLLAYLAHLDHRPPTVVSLRSSAGVLITDPDAVAEEFRSFLHPCTCLPPTSLVLMRPRY